jgi:hypothetical protein
LVEKSAEDVSAIAEKNRRREVEIYTIVECERKREGI